MNKAKYFLIIIGSIFLTVGFYKTFHALIKPLVFCGVVLATVYLYDGIFGKNKPQAGQQSNAGMGSVEVSVKSVGEMVDTINRQIKGIKSKAKNNANYSMISHFLEQITEFEDAIPRLHEGYKRGMRHTASIEAASREMIEIQNKLRNSQGNARTIYEKALREKEATVDEYRKIGENLAEAESKLFYIHTILGKIEAVIESVEMNDSISDSEITDLNNKLEVFSENIKETLSSIKL